MDCDAGWLDLRFSFVLFVMLVWFVAVGGLVCLLSVSVVFVLLYGCYVCVRCDKLLVLAHLLCAKTTRYTPGGGRGGVRGRKGVDDVREGQEEEEEEE